MARGKKFHFTYGTQNNEQHTVEIWVEGFSGTSEELQPAAMPVLVDYNKTVAESYMGGIVPAQITIKAQSSATFKASVFTSQNYGDVIIKHKTGSTVDFNCVLVPFVTRDIDLPDGAFGVELSCEFGLNYLKNIDYPTSTNRVKIADVLHTCISYVPVEDTFSYKILDGVLVASDGIGTDATRYFESYVSEENYADKTCYEVLEDICQGIREIFFSDGYWWVRNLAEINKSDSTIYNYSALGAYVDSTAYARPTTEAGSGVRLKGTFGKEFAHSDLTIRKDKSKPLERFPEGQFVNLDDWTTNGLAGAIFSIEDGQLYNNGNSYFGTDPDDSGTYLVNTTGLSFYPFRSLFEQGVENDVVSIEVKATNGSAIKNLRLQIIAYQVDQAETYFLTTEGAWYRQIAGVSATPIYTVDGKSGTAKIDIPKPPYNGASPVFTLPAEYGVFEGLNNLFPSVTKEYQLFIRVLMPERVSNAASGSYRDSYIDYISVSIKNPRDEVFEGFEKIFGVSNSRDRSGRLEVELSTGFPTAPNGTESLYLASMGTDFFTHYKGVDDASYSELTAFISAQYLDILAIRHRSWTGELYAKLSFEDLVEIDSVKYRIHNLMLNRWDKISKVTLVELTDSSDTITESESNIRNVLKATIQKYVAEELEQSVKPTRFNDKNIRVEYDLDGLKEVKLVADPIFDSTLLESGVLNLLREDNEATTAINWTDIDGTVTDYLRPDSDGFFYLKTEGNSEEQIATAETAWMLGAPNALTAKSFIGSASGAHDIGVKVNDTEVLTFKNGGKIGHGTTDPVGHFHIKAVDEAANLLTSATNAALFIEPYSASTWGMAFGSISGQIQYIQGVSAAGGSARDISIQPYGGNTGFGTSAARATVDIVGTTAINIINAYPSASLPTTLTMGYTSTGISFITEYSQSFNSGKMAVIRHELVGAGNGHLHFETYAGGSGGGTRMSILNNGNVAIGTTSGTKKLTVNGDIQGTEITLTTGASSGYILQSDSSGKGVWTSPAALVQYKGSWNPTTNSPSLSDGTGTVGDYYRILNTFSRDLGSGTVEWTEGYDVRYNGSIWEELPVGSLAIASDIVLGGVKIGSTVEVDGSGVLNQKSGVVTPDTYRSVTVDTYGRVTAGTNPTTIAGYGITDAFALADGQALQEISGVYVGDGTSPFGLTGSDDQFLIARSSADGGFEFITLNHSYISDWDTAWAAKWANTIANSHIIASAGISETLTLTEGSFERVLKGLYLSGGDTDTRETFFVGTDFNTGSGVFRLQYYNPSDVLSAVEMSFDLADAGRPIVYDPNDATEAIKHVMYQEDFATMLSDAGVSTGSTPTLQQVLDAGSGDTNKQISLNNSPYLTRARFDELTANFGGAQGLDSVLQNGANSTDKDLNFIVGDSNIHGLKFKDSSGTVYGELEFQNVGSPKTMLLASYNSANLTLWSGGYIDMVPNSGTSYVNISGELKINKDITISDATQGVVLRAPNGNYWRVTVDNSGNLTTTAI